MDHYHISNIKLREILQLPNDFEKKRTMKGWQTSQEIFFEMNDLSLVGIFVNNLMISQLSTKCAFFLLSNRSVKQRLYISSVILSKENKQLYKLQKQWTSLFHHVLLKNRTSVMLQNWLPNATTPWTLTLVPPTKQICYFSFNFSWNFGLRDLRVQISVKSRQQPKSQIGSLCLF